MKFTIDQFLGGKVLLKQSQKGMRATSDSVLLAAFLPVKKGESILDVGAGNGAIGCCCNARVPCTIFAIEIQEKLCSLISENAQLNHQKIEIIQHDILALKDPLKGKLFHHVVTNPPFYEKSENTRQNPEQNKAFVQDFDLTKWLNYCLKHVRSNGSFNLIHRPEMLPQILPILAQKLGNIEILPIVSKKGQQAKRVLIRGFLNKKGPLVLHFPIILHTKDDKYTKTAENILRFGNKIDFT